MNQPHKFPLDSIVYVDNFKDMGPVTFVVGRARLYVVCHRWDDKGQPVYDLSFYRTEAWEDYDVHISGGTSFEDIYSRDFAWALVALRLFKGFKESELRD
jgi:hypothetical protein